jgi:non-heme chloroperoxidase
MRVSMRALALLTAMAASNLPAQDIAGVWQGVANEASGQQHVVMHVSHAGAGWAAAQYVIENGPDSVTASSGTLQGAHLVLYFPRWHGTYDGIIQSDGKRIVGTWLAPGDTINLDLRRPGKEGPWALDPSPHTIRLVRVDTGVRLEVLDWGGTGRPVVLLTGLGSNAHVFDRFAPKLTAWYHVYGITRRGIGASSAPLPTSANYAADRLANDVLAVLDTLRLKRPILVGHSIAGEEMSSIGSRFPDRVSGLVYLDAGYWYAFYDRTRGALVLDLDDLLDKLPRLDPTRDPTDARPLIQALLDTLLPRFEGDLKRLKQDEDLMPPSWLAGRPSSDSNPAAFAAISRSEQKYVHIGVPALAFYAVPHRYLSFGADSARRLAFEARDSAEVEAQAEAFAAANSAVRIVRLPHASHSVFESNEADVLREINAFIATLP